MIAHKNLCHGFYWADDGSGVEPVEVVDSVSLSNTLMVWSLGTHYRGDVSDYKFISKIRKPKV